MDAVVAWCVIGWASDLSIAAWISLVGPSLQLRYLAHHFSIHFVDRSIPSHQLVRSHHIARSPHRTTTPPDCLTKKVLTACFGVVAELTYEYVRT